MIDWLSRRPWWLGIVVVLLSPLAALMTGCGNAPAAAAAQHVELLRTPDGGIQPQAAVDAAGTVHLVYFKGEAGAGDRFYVRRGPGKTAWPAPLRVNSQPGTAVAMGTIRGGQLALGSGGRGEGAS